MTNIFVKILHRSETLRRNIGKDRLFYGNHLNMVDFYLTPENKVKVNI